MPELPPVTVVVATYDRAGYLATAIESVLGQDYPDLECLVVDDGSTDATPEVLARYEGRITVLSQENQGQPAAVNHGFAAARGELLGVLGSDDRLFAGVVSATARALQEAPDAVAAHGDVLVTDDDERPLRTHSTGAFQFLDCLRHHISPSSTGVLYRRWAMEAAGGWDPEFPYGPDTEVWWRLGLLGPYVYVPRMLGTFRLHAGSISGMDGHDVPRAAEYVRSTEKFLARDDLPAAVDAGVRAEAMRSAYYSAAVIVGGQLNREGERYTLKDDWVARFTTLPGAYPEGEEPAGAAALEASGDAAAASGEAPVGATSETPAEAAAGASTSARADATAPALSAELPLLSVVTPCYNGARFLVETIEAVLAQDYPRLEHIILDDGSTDESPAIIHTYAARYPDRIRACHHENRGQAHTINRGFELACGELLSVVNCDDPVLPGLFTRMVAELVASPGLAGAYPDFLVIDENGQTIVELHPPDYSLVEMVRLGDNFLGPGVVFRKTVVDAVGGWSPDYPSTLDLEFWLRGALFGDYAHVPEVLATWRSHAGAKTVRDRMTDEAIQERFRILDAFFARPNVPEEVRAVRDEAYKNMHFITGVIMTPEVNAPGERFVIHDRYARRAAGHPSIESEIAVYQESLERSMVATEESQEVVRRLQEQLKAAVGAGPGAMASGSGGAGAEARALEAERRLSIVAASTSWRITRPLRWARRAGASAAARYRSRR